MSQIPFKVSARAARLIGRENVSNADGAIIELVKNSYDADSKVCVLYFDNRYSNVPTRLLAEEFNQFKNEVSFPDAFTELYKKSDDYYYLNQNIEIDNYNMLSQFFKSKSVIYIIDSGDGMTDEIIKNSWMTIGTNYKESNYISNAGRIRSGAKGIGRFALDRLGNECEMITLPKGKKNGFRWKVRWDLFEKEDSIIDDVYAELEEVPQLNFKHNVLNYLQNIIDNHQDLKSKSFDNGTILKISSLRDEWNEQSINKIFIDMETLVPPKESSHDFEIFLLTSLQPKKYGQIIDSVCDDYDYKLVSKLTGENKVEITIFRNEFDLSKLPDNIFDIPELSLYPYDRETMLKGEYTISRDINELIIGYDKSQYKDLFKDLGIFDFTLYFLKQNDANKVEMKKYYQKRVNSSMRMAWMEKFGGIKIYRDHFIIRPYGDPGSASFDWLGLGERAAKSPAAPSHKTGQWRVRPYQVCGVINISRIENLYFEDKSSREGFQENEYFDAFKNLLISIVSLLERDRQTLFRAFNKYFEQVNEKALTIKMGTQLANKIVAKFNETNIIIPNEQKQQYHILAETVKALSEEKEELVSELKLVRALASIGLVISSFTHQLQGLSSRLIARSIYLERVLENLIPEDKIKNLPRNQNPFQLVEQFRNDDNTLEKWLDFSLKMIKKDKRRRKKIDIIKFLYDYINSWTSALEFYDAHIFVKNNINESFMFYAFQIDFDSIFSNLIANSLDAFTKRKDRVSNTRHINISVQETIKYNNVKFLSINYSDTGPGLMKEIKDPYIIFEPHFTTKKDSAGNEVGTGLGMWIVKSTIEEYNGETELLFGDNGFNLMLHIPLKRDEGAIKQ